MFILILLDRNLDKLKLELAQEEEQFKEFGNKLEQNQQQIQTFQSNTSLLNWTEVSPNFTPELIQVWINHNFMAKQCRDWININSPDRQQQAVQEPEFYAWLRDNSYTPEQVLNESNLEQLKAEYQASQQTAQIQVKPNK